MIPANTPLWIALPVVCVVMSVIVGLRYLLTSGLFAAITRAKHPRLYAGQIPQIRREIAYSLLSAVIYGAPAGAALYAWRHHGMTAIYGNWHAFPLWYAPLSLVIYLAVQDTWFYWTHRAMHASPAVFRFAHRVHHQSRPPTAWSAMNFHPAEALSVAFVIPVVVFVVPIHPVMLGLVLAIATIMGVTNHLGWEIFPRQLVHSPLGRWLITASHHQRHHEDYQCNYGLYFRLWDHLCATDRGLKSWDRQSPKQAGRLNLP